MNRQVARLALLLAVVAVAACSPPEPKPTPSPATGVNVHPDRPKDVPANYQAFTWVVKFVDRQGYSLHGSADINILAEVVTPVVGSLPGFPIKTWTQVPYSYTIWYPPGAIIKTDVYSKARPAIGPDDFNVGTRSTCFGVLFGPSDQPAAGVVEDPQSGQLGVELAHCSYTIGGP